MRSAKGLFGLLAGNVQGMLEQEICQPLGLKYKAKRKENKFLRNYFLFKSANQKLLTGTLHFGQFHIFCFAHIQ